MRIFAPAADNDNCYRWVFIPTGEEDTYYIYNVGRQRFIEPLDLGTYHTLKGGKTWVFTPNKVPIKLTALGNNKFSIRTAETNHRARQQTHHALAGGHDGIRKHQHPSHQVRNNHTHQHHAQH